ncbi:unnamed protein product [Lymnaea stagnalis]|uniref:THD domain-containing protein n=1 Tax=Lymnaea stagnalis TaxID=6523 RepID=A0AAV2HIS7_LYMST
MTRSMSRGVFQIMECLLAVGSVTMAIAALILVSFQKKTLVAKESEFCLPVQEWGCLNGALVKNLTRGNAKMGHDLRCFRYKDPGQMLVALTMVLDCQLTSCSRHNVLLTTTDDIDLSSARFRMVPSPNMTGNTSISMTFSEPGLPTATEHRRNVALHQRDSIVILAPGMYYVYATIYFYQDPDKACHFRTNSVYARIVTVLLTEVKHQVGRREILTVSHSCGQHCQFDEETQQNGTSILLAKGDVLQVTVFPGGVVQTDNYLGLVMLWLVQ